MRTNLLAGKERLRLLLVGSIPILLIALIGCTSEPRYEYPEAVRANFLAACRAQPGADTDECACALREVQDQLDIDAVEEMESSLAAGGTLSRDLSRVMEECKSD